VILFLGAGVFSCVSNFITSTSLICLSIQHTIPQPLLGSGILLAATVVILHSLILCITGYLDTKGLLCDGRRRMGMLRIQQIWREEVTKGWSKTIYWEALDTGGM
jgi:hypothetical protein